MNSAGTHSEVDAVAEYTRRYGRRRLTGLSLVNLRLNPNGRVHSCRPCPRCAAFLARHRFERMYFSLPEKRWEVVRDFDPQRYTYSKTGT